MNGMKKSAYFNTEIVRWLSKVAKREGFNFSQALNWVLRKAMDKDKNDQQ